MNACAIVLVCSWTSKADAKNSTNFPRFRYNLEKHVSLKTVFKIVDIECKFLGLRFFRF